MKCVACGKAKMVHDTRDVPYTYKGQTTIIPGVTGEFCSACDESLHNAEESERLNAAMLEFNKEVNGASVDPAFITKTRKKLKLDQQEAAEIFGGGVNAFSRYEKSAAGRHLRVIYIPDAEGHSTFVVTAYELRGKQLQAYRRRRRRRGK
jgi:HTH-type transcriptional regulator/antitoxin MqsA